MINMIGQPFLSAGPLNPLILDGFDQPCNGWTWEEYFVCCLNCDC